MKHSQDTEDTEATEGREGREDEAPGGRTTTGGRRFRPLACKRGRRTPPRSALPIQTLSPGFGGHPYTDIPYAGVIRSTGPGIRTPGRSCGWGESTAVRI